MEENSLKFKEEIKPFDFGRNKLCKFSLQKNIVFADVGKPLDIPLSRLNRCCDFKKEFEKTQEKWYGIPADIKANKKESQKKYRETHRQKINVKQRESYQRKKQEFINGEVSC